MKRVLIALVMLLTLLVSYAVAQEIAGLRLVGVHTIPTGSDFEGTEVGGISGLDYNADTDTYWLLSDDRSENAPARAYTAEITFGLEGFEAVELNSVVTLEQPDGSTYPEGSVDPESIRVLGQSVYWSGEGQNSEEGVIPPSVREMTLEGEFVRELALPGLFLPNEAGTVGVRDNLALEAIAISPDGRSLFAASENSLLQDGPISTLTETGVARVARIDLETGAPQGMFAYVVDPIPAAPDPVEGFADNGLTSLIALGDMRFLALERSFSEGVGNANRIYLVDASRADDVSSLLSLEGERFAPARKTLLLDLTTLGIRLDNHEAMTFGPDFENGHRSLIVVSDNNFNDSQITQFLLFEVLEGAGQ